MTFDYWKRFEYINNNGQTKRDGIKFERLVKCLLEMEFNCQWIQTGKSHDDNRDFYQYIKNQCIWAECKNYKSNLSMDIIAPTLVMAQIYDVKTIIFFSSSPFNKSARKKLYLYADRTGKKLHIYDGDALIALIKKHNGRLPDEFKLPVPINDNPSSPVPTCDFLYIQNPIVGIALEDRYIRPINTIKSIFFNTTFEIAILIQNTDAIESAEVKINLINNDIKTFESQDDIYSFEIIDNRYKSIIDYADKATLAAASGLLYRIFLRQRRFKTPIQLPRFFVEVKIKNHSAPYRFRSPGIAATSEWIGETSLLGEHYHQILTQLESRLLCTGNLGIMCLAGSSGTGKTRLSKESIDKLLKNKYRILYFSHDSGVSSLNILKELVFFLYEIPREDIIEDLEKYTNKRSAEQNDNRVSVAFSIIRHFRESRDVESFIKAIDMYGDIIFEKLSASKLAIIIDNVQYFEREIKYFLTQYINYSLSQNRSNHSILFVTFNTDFSDSTSNALIDKIKSLNGHLKINVVDKELTGFKTSSQCVVFLRQLMLIKDDRYNHVLYAIANKVSYKPFHLAQAVKHLNEMHAIKTATDNSLYPLEIEVFNQLVREMPSKIAEILQKRWNSFLNNNNSEKLTAELIISLILLFGPMNEVLIAVLKIDRGMLNLLVGHLFLRREIYTDRGTVIYFEHGIIEKFFADTHPHMISNAIHHILDKKIVSRLDTKTAPYALCMFKLNYSKETCSKLLPILSKINVPKHLQSIYIEQWQRYLKNNMDDIELSSSCQSFYDLCTRANDFFGIMRSSTIYAETISSLAPYEDALIDAESDIYITIIGSYVDVLVKSGKPDEAIDLLEDKCLVFQAKLSSKIRSACNDYLFCNLSKIYNRMQIAYRTIETEEARTKTWEVLKKSKYFAMQVNEENLRYELEYLNYSDEGYCYYCYLKDKNQLLAIWGNWRKYEKILPQKTLNMYRKKTQIHIINNNPSEALRTIAEAEEYMKSGRYVYERLAFQTFFVQAKIVALMLKGPESYSSAIGQALAMGLERELMMPSGRGDKYMQLAAIHAYYRMDIQAAHHNFMQSYDALQRSRYQHNYAGKLYLLSSNILFCYVSRNVHQDHDFDFSYWKDSPHYALWLDLSRAGFKQRNEFLDSWRVDGILQTIDGRFNLPLV